MKRINLWSSPRNISTALMYSFAQRPDTTVVDEPLYGYYLASTDSRTSHPGKEEILHFMETDGPSVIREMLLKNYPTPIVIFKQMTHHLEHLDRQFLFEMENVLLIRNPAEIIASYARVIPNPGIDDIGVEKQNHLFNLLIENGKLSAVIDAKILLSDPRKILGLLCERLDIPFTEKMLSWPAGPRPEDGIWARYWYANVHLSTGFQPYREKEPEVPDHLTGLVQQCMPFYDELYEHALK